MTLPEYYKEYCLDGHKYRTGLDHITVNGKPVEEFLKTEEQKEVESVYKEDLSTNSNKNPVCFGKPKHKPKKERNGKVRKISPQEYYNQEPNGNFGKCTKIKHVVISLLLSGVSAYTSRELYVTIDKYSDRNIDIKNRIATEKFKIDKIYTIMWELKKSALGMHLFKTPTGKNKKDFAYYLSEEARSFTLEEAIELSKNYKKGLRKSTIKKAVKKAKDQRESFNKNQLEFLNKMLSQIVLKEDFKKYIEEIYGQITDLKSLVNELMINTPARSESSDNCISSISSDPNNIPASDPFKRVFGIDSNKIDSNKIEVKVKGGIEVLFRIAE